MQMTKTILEKTVTQLQVENNNLKEQINLKDREITLLNRFVRNSSALTEALEKTTDAVAHVTTNILRYGIGKF